MGTASSSQNFYDKSFTVIVSILEMIKNVKTTPEICKSLGISKQRLFYYTSKLTKCGYIEMVTRDAFNIWKVTQGGQTFLGQYQSSNNKHNNKPIGRVEHIRFKAAVISLPEPIPSNWKKVNMNNWSEYCFELNDVKIKLNCGLSPTVEFIMPPVDDYEGNPQKISCLLQTNCLRVVQQVQDIYNMCIGPIELSSNGEWVVYDPIAKAVSEQCNVNIHGVAKINSSKPVKRGEFEFPTPYAAASYLNGINMIPELLETMKRVLKLIESRDGIAHG